MRALLPALLLLIPLLAQQPDANLARRTRLRDEAKAAFDRETAREKAGQCKDSRTTRDNVSCLNDEAEATQANFDIYVRNLRALLALQPPEDRIQQFEKLEAAWRDYSKTACDAAYDLYKGGTIAPIIEIDCQQRLQRSHLRELEAIYGDYFSR